MSSADFPETSTLPQEQASAVEEPQSRTVGTNIIVGVVSLLLVVAIGVVAFLLISNAKTGEPSSTENSSTAGQPSSAATPLTADERAKEGFSLGKEMKAGTANESTPQIDIYFDYSCSHCNHLGNDYGAGLGEAAKAGDITLIYHPVAIMGTLFSYTGAGAEFFVAENEPDKYFVFHELLHEKIMTPYMNGDLTNPSAQNIVDIAKEAGVSDKNCQALLKELTDMEDILVAGDTSRSTPLLTRVIESTNRFVDESMAMTGGAGTPTVYIDNVKSGSWSTDIPNLLSQ